MTSNPANAPAKSAANMLAADRRERSGAESIDQLALFEPEGLRDPGPVCRIRLGAVADVPLLDVQFRVAHCTRRVLEQHLLLVRRHLPEQVAGLLPMVILNAVGPARRIALDRH